MPQARVIKLSKLALADFDRIYDHLRKYSNHGAATKRLRSLDAAIERLIEQPMLGRPYRHRRETFRVLTHKDYRVFYQVHQSTIELVRVLNGKQNIPDILDEL